MKNNYIIRLEKEKDYRETEILTREAFWNVYRPGCTEHYILHCYRSKKDFIPELDLVMEKEGKLIGHVMYVNSEIKTDNGTIIPIVTFGPLSILPEYKRQGYGSILLNYSMNKAFKMGAGAIAITGNIDFYGKLGFVTGKSLNIMYSEDPDADYFLIKELKPEFLKNISGTFRDPEGYFTDENEAEKFDSQFSFKEKLKLPGQLI